MPTKRYLNLAPAQQRQILDAAMAEFCLHGFEKASLNRIIQEAGMSKGVFYYYFEDKADLYVSVFQDVSETMSAFIVQAPAPDPQADYWAFMAFAQRRKLEFTAAHPELMQLATDFMRLAAQPNPPAAILAVARLAEEQTVPYCLMGQQAGAVRSDLSAELLIKLWQAIGETALAPFLKDPGSMTPALVDHHLSLTMDLLKRISMPAPGQDRPDKGEIRHA